mmetsp:Transcript_9832/g.24086  ORF Transcript_9832/g.24086 Transcript_9832/m.24086 type:complete len:200 (-) Transcript_9832:171-770(-)
MVLRAPMRAWRTSATVSMRTSLSLMLKSLACAVICTFIREIARVNPPRCGLSPWVTWRETRYSAARRVVDSTRSRSRARARASSIGTWLASSSGEHHRSSHRSSCKFGSAQSAACSPRRRRAVRKPSPLRVSAPSLTSFLPSGWTVLGMRSNSLWIALRITVECSRTFSATVSGSHSLDPHPSVKKKPPGTSGRLVALK